MVFDEDLLSECARQRRAALARSKVQGAACSEWHNETNGLGRPHLCLGGQRSDRKRKTGSAFNEAASFDYLHAIPLRQGFVADEIAGVWPKAETFGFPNEMEAFGLQFGHGLGLGLHERPIISRLNSLEHPIEIQAGMVFALETYCPAVDGYSAARIEEEIVCTDDGPRLLTLFPAEELVVTNRY